MQNVSDVIDSYLLPLDPIRGLRRYGEDLQRYAALDPRIQEAMSLIGDRLNGLSDKERDALGPILWTSVRSAVANPRTLARLRRFGVDGGLILPAVERALDEKLTVEVLQRVVQEADAVTQSDGIKGGRLRESADELNATGGPDALLAVGVAIAIVVIVALPVVAVASAIDQ
jgi:hypothetical protein